MTPKVKYINISNIMYHSGLLKNIICFYLAKYNILTKSLAHLFESIGILLHLPLEIHCLLTNKINLHI